MALQPVFILGPHKSGSTLLRNLFDGIPDHFVCPVETHFFKLMGRWVDYDLHRNFPEKVNAHELYQRFVDRVEHFNTRDNPYGDADLKGRFNIERFKKAFEQLHEGMDEREVIELYFKSLHAALFEDELQHDKVVHKTVGLAEHAMELKRTFPEARFIHIVRNPYANLVSFRNFRRSNKGPYPLLDRLLKSLNNNFYFLYKNRELLADDYHVIRYEDLLQWPERTMRWVTGELGIPFSESMLSPTMLGADWAGNSTTDARTLEGIDPGRLDNWKADIHPMEIFYVNKYFPHICRDYGYEKEIPRSGFLKPAKGESPARYCYNRIYRIFDRDLYNLRNQTKGL